MQEPRESLIIKINTNKQLIEDIIKKSIDTIKIKDLKSIDDNISKSKLMLSSI